MSDLTLQIAASGIEADEAELDTAAQNLSNVSTPGYAQEIVNLANNTPSATTGVGQGVTITSVSEGSSSLYDQLNLVSQGQLGAANEAASIQSLAQNAFPEPSTTGLSVAAEPTLDRPVHPRHPTLVHGCPGGGRTGREPGRADPEWRRTRSSPTSPSSSRTTSRARARPTAATSGQANQLINQIASLNGSILAGQNGGSQRQLARRPAPAGR